MPFTLCGCSVGPTIAPPYPAEFSAHDARHRNSIQYNLTGQSPVSEGDSTRAPHRRNPSARLGFPVWQRLERDKPNQPLPALFNRLSATIRRTGSSASDWICDSATCHIVCWPTTARWLRPDATPGMPSSPRLAALNPGAHFRISKPEMLRRRGITSSFHPARTA
jgi:hypothetical protein